MIAEVLAAAACWGARGRCGDGLLVRLTAGASAMPVAQMDLVGSAGFLLLDGMTAMQ